MNNLRTITDPFDIIDALDGELSGDYSFDINKVEEDYITFSVTDYREAVMMSDISLS